MRQLSKVLLVIFIFMAGTASFVSAHQSGVKYSIPVEYKNLSENELKPIAHDYFYSSLNAEGCVLNEDTTKALNLYTILQQMNPQNISYSIKLGILYDKLGKDRYAKGSFAHAIGIAPTKAVGYYYYGEYYYKRGQFRQALRYYNQALEYLEKPSYELYYKLGDVYQKFGDTKQSLKYLNLAKDIKPNSEINSKIKNVEITDSVNIMYYRD
ncbi:MAG: tetratricopeptide repeat protein [bacterium]|nr:tetratricopeptide repeat protein [bacterium]